MNVVEDDRTMGGVDPSPCRNWLFVARLSAGLSILLLCVAPATELHATWGRSCCSSSDFDLIVPTAGIVPLLAILFRLRSPRRDSLRRLVSGLKLASFFGPVSLGLIPLFHVLSTARENPFLEPGVTSLPAYWVTLGLIQLGLIISARVLLRSIRHADPDALMDTGHRFEGILYLWLIVVVAVVSQPGLHTEGFWRGREAAARYRMLQLSTVQEQYRVRYPANGFAATLADLSREGYIDGAMAGGTVWGYRFTLTPNRARDGTFAGYTATARPVRYGNNGGCRSYRLDESGVIRWTDEDRAATAEDPPLGESDQLR